MSKNPLSKSDPISPRLARYSHAGESGREPPSAYGISPRFAGGELCTACLASFALLATTAMFAALFVIT